MQTWRSTGACIRLTLASVRLVFWVQTGSLHLEDWRLRRLIVASVAAALCGLTLGNIGNRHLSQERWRGIIVCILFSAALLLATTDIKEPVPLEDMAVFFILLAPPLALLAYSAVRLTRGRDFWMMRRSSSRRRLRDEASPPRRDTEAELVAAKPPGVIDGLRRGAGSSEGTELGGAALSPSCGKETGNSVEGLLARTTETDTV